MAIMATRLNSVKQYDDNCSGGDDNNDHNVQIIWPKIVHPFLHKLSDGLFCNQEHLRGNNFEATIYMVSLKKGSLAISAPLEPLGWSTGLDISKNHCQSSFLGWLHYFLTFNLPILILFWYSQGWIYVTPRNNKYLGFGCFMLLFDLPANFDICVVQVLLY